MKNLQGTLTEQNLYEALKGESVARNKYTYYASRAREDGYEQIARIFEQTANNEKEHAKIWFKLLVGGEIKDTKENLKDAVSGEHYENISMYPEFAKIAKEEGFNDISKLFEMVSHIEGFHERRYRALLKNLEEGMVFKKEQSVCWECSNCGYSIDRDKAPDICPVCQHKQAYFFIKNNDFA